MQSPTAEHATRVDFARWAVRLVQPGLQRDAVGAVPASVSAGVSLLPVLSILQLQEHGAASRQALVLANILEFSICQIRHAAASQLPACQQGAVLTALQVSCSFYIRVGQELGSALALQSCWLHARASSLLSPRVGAHLQLELPVEAPPWLTCIDLDPQSPRTQQLH